MRDVVRTRSVPQIIVSNADYERLTDLATASLERLPEVANELLSEMDRAKVVQDGSVPDNVVRMGSTVTFKSDDGNTRTFKLEAAAEVLLVVALVVQFGAIVYVRASLAHGKLTVEVRDRQGNTARIERTFSISGNGR